MIQERQGSSYRVATEDGVQFGRFNLWGKGNEVELWSVFIDEDKRGRGLGKVLMRDVDQAVSEDFPQASCISLCVATENKVAQRLYAHAGYRKVGYGIRNRLRHFVKGIRRLPGLLWESGRPLIMEKEVPAS
jgi:ribosomal protein S18 acetylase RimI-like enzyme